MQSGCLKLSAESNSASESKINLHQPVIVGYARTPVGSFLGSLSSIDATELGAIAIKESVSRARVLPTSVEAVFMGCAISAGLGQCPARISALKAGLPVSVSAVTVNKVCSSGMKAITLGCQEILLGMREVVVCGGMESMSRAPHLDRNRRLGQKYGAVTEGLDDSVDVDGLRDAMTKEAMGIIAEDYATSLGITREEQDTFAVGSFTKAIAATEEKMFEREIVPVNVVTRKETIVVSKDEQLGKFNPSKMRALPPYFSKTGSITAANGSAISDGAAALVIVSWGYAVSHALDVLAVIEAFGEHSMDGRDYGLAPIPAVEKVLRTAGVLASDIDAFEINEAFSVIALANIKKLGLDEKKVNMFGGAVALGHPIGASGARILCTLISVLHAKSLTRGVASICNGGGEGMALLIRRDMAVKSE